MFSNCVNVPSFYLSWFLMFQMLILMIQSKRKQRMKWSVHKTKWHLKRIFQLNILTGIFLPSLLFSFLALLRQHIFAKISPSLYVHQFVITSLTCPNYFGFTMTEWREPRKWFSLSVFSVFLHFHLFGSNRQTYLYHLSSILVEVEWSILMKIDCFMQVRRSRK